MVRPNENCLRIRALAGDDLVNIFSYVNRDSPASADRFIDEFYRAAENLAERPGLGPVRRSRGRLKGLRSWPLTSFGPYVIYYLPLREGGIEVVRVLHGARNAERELRKS